MFARRKKQDGFEWHKYIRTTIKIRREQRRQRVVDARHAAGQQMGAAGAALAAGSKAAGLAARDGARAGLGAAGLATQGAWAVLKTGICVLARHTVAGAQAAIVKLAAVARPVTEVVSRPNVGGPIALAGGIALGAGIGRWRSSGLDGEALTTLAMAAALLMAAMPTLSRTTGIGMPRWVRLAMVSGPGLGAMAVAAVIAATVWFANHATTDFAGIAARLPLIGSALPLRGRAQAITGDTMRIGSSTVRLAGIEAPETEQRCGKGNRQWRCATAAQAALSRLVGGRDVHCTIEGSDDTGRSRAYCTSGNMDINGELVRQGYVFAETGLFAPYAAFEKEASAQRVGVWSGDAERPSQYRAKAWEEAKRRAPDGCPIKGLVTGSGRIYVLPGAPDYERGRIQKGRGERWFCSERDAQSAGFKAAERG
jgi:endonuclease YncB( thermonuclease family)